MGRKARKVNFAPTLCGVSALFFAPAIYAAAGPRAPAGNEKTGNEKTGNEKPSVAPERATVDVACLARRSFAVEPFVNLEGVKILAHLEAGLPAIIAERLALHSPLRFSGGPQLLPADEVAAGGHRDTPTFTVRGRFEKLGGLRLRVSVEIVKTQQPDVVVGRADREGPRDRAEVLAVQAAHAAFATIAGVAMAPLGEQDQRPFGRDPYAFTLYARGVARYFGLGGTRPDAVDALALLGRSLVIDPKVSETRRFVGLIHLLDGRPGHARTNWMIAEDLRPNDAMLIEGLAQLDHSEGSREAEGRYARLLQLDPENVNARRVYGEVLYERGELGKAQQELEQVLARRPDDMRARRSLTLVLSARKAGPQLVRALETVVELDPEDMDARMDLAAAYLGENRLAEAAAVYGHVLDRRNRDAPALKMAADLALRRGHLEEATDHYQKLRRISPGDPRPIFLLGTVFHRAGNVRAAERMFEEGAAIPGMRPEAFANLGAIALETGRAREARWFLKRAAQWRPNDASVRYNYALALRALDQHAEALNELRAAQVADPDDAQIHHVAGIVALRLGLLREAEIEFQAAVNLDPNHEAARHNLKLLEGMRGPLGESATFINVAP